MVDDVAGQAKSSEYGSWIAMWQRCTNPKCSSYKNYGGRGIAVCDRWKSFENFLADMGPKPSLYHSIEREKNDEGYSKSNCRWATPKEQAANRRPRMDGLFTRKVSENAYRTNGGVND